MANEKVDFIGSVRNNWIASELESTRNEIGDLYPRVVPFVVRLVEWLENGTEKKASVALEEIVHEIAQERLPVADVFSLSGKIHRSWKAKLVNDTYSLQAKIQ